MSKKKPDKPTGSPAGRRDAAEPGLEVRPETTPADQPGQGCADNPTGHGLPLPIEHYEALQKAAKDRKTHNKAAAQEDPGAGGP